MKRTVCIVFLILLLVGQAVPPAAAVIPADMPAPADTAQIAERIMKLMEEYPSGSYFTKSGQSCNGHSTFANCREVTAEEAGTPGTRQCFGFARMVFWHVFGLPFGKNNDEQSWLPIGPEMENVNRIWVGDPGTRLDEAAVRQAFSSAMIGDFIQCGIPHSMIFLQMEEEGILVYDANYEMVTCRVLVHVVEWEVLMKWIRRYGMSYYRSVNYPTVVDHDLFPYEDFNGGNVANIKVSAHPSAQPVLVHAPDLAGLELTYTKGSKTCTLTCTGGETFHITGSFGDMTVTAGGEGEYAPRLTLTPGAGYRVGSVQVDFLDAAAIVICPVEKREPQLLSFTYPTLCRYSVGETFDPAGATLSVKDEDNATHEFAGGEIVFTGFDLSKPGEYAVTMEAGGLTTPPFTLTVVQGGAGTPVEEFPPYDAGLRILLAVLILFAAGAVMLFVIRSVRRTRRRRR